MSEVDYREHEYETETITHFLIEYPAVAGHDTPLLFVGDVGLGSLLAAYLSPAARQMFHAWFYDRRGLGRSVAKSDEPINPDVLYRDLSEVIDYILQQTGHRQLVLVGEGYGSALTARYAGNHPAKVCYYAGISQVTCPDDYEKARCTAMELVFNKKNQMKNVLFMSEVHELTGGSYHLDLLPPKQKSRLLLMQHGMGMHSYHRDKILIQCAQRSPYWDKKAGKKQVEEAIRQAEGLMDMEVKFQLENFEDISKVPGIWISGRHDFVNPYILVREYHEHLYGKKNQMQLELVEDRGADILYQDPIACWAMIWKHFREIYEGV